MLEDESVRLIDFENSSTCNDTAILEENAEVAALLGGCGIGSGPD